MTQPQNHSPDPLKDLLNRWELNSPIDAKAFKHETMSLIKSSRKSSVFVFLKSSFESFLENWLPDPGLLIPVATLIVIIIGGVEAKEYWDASKRIAAMEWKSELSNPLSASSLAGILTQKEK